MENDAPNLIEHSQTTSGPTDLIKRWCSLLSRVFGGGKSGALPAVGNGGSRRPVILPFSVRQALQLHSDRFRVNEITALLDPCYGPLGLYLACKYLSDTPHLLQKLLESYIYYSQSRQSPSDYQLFRNTATPLLEQHGLGKAVNGVKSGQLSRLGFSIDDRGIAILAELRQSGATPVFVLYASVLMIDSVLTWMQAGDSVYFLDPYDSTDTSQGITQEGVDQTPDKEVVHLTLRDQNFRGRLLRKDDNEQISVTMIESDESLVTLLSDTPSIRLIDDTKNPSNPSFLHIYTRLSQLLGAGTPITTDFAVAGEL